MNAKRWFPPVAVLVLFVAPWTQIALERFPAFVMPGVVIWAGVFAAMLSNGALLRTVRKLAAGAATFLLAVLLLQGDYIAVAMTFPEQGDALILDRMGIVEGAGTMIVVAAVAFGVAEYRVWKVELAPRPVVSERGALTTVSTDPAQRGGARHSRRWLATLAVGALAVELARRRRRGSR
ncbi:hypothetical protein [Cellulomonas hominis]|uniref:hypothetical protein n=1 Tax=Cellulomonas hominis TaxID=156981 RepID=UPI001B9B063E|nr:hypothetical protein [Cellulomonas hominis]VTR77749.1 hypothetical protein CHMI_02521 [Cellulomonas hominis]